MRVVQWSTGNVGRHALAGIIAHPELELAGVWVSTQDKAGRDAGELAGLPPVGIAATTDADALLATKPDCVVYTAMADDRLPDALADLARFLRAGANVVASGPVFLQYPHGVVPADLVAPIHAATAEGGTSLWVNGIDPGFANDWLPLVLTSVCQRIDQVRCLEILDYATYDNAKVLFDIMGFGRPMDDTPILLQPGVLSLAWGSVVRQLADGLGVALDRVEDEATRLPAPHRIEIPAGVIEEGTAAALRFEVRGIAGGRPVVVVEHVTRLHPGLGPDWPTMPGQGGYRVEVTGDPNYRLDLTIAGEDGDHNTGGLKATAMRLVNAIPAVVAAKPGLLTALDLPLITGRGLVKH
jgi:4-hydroxy-tetrahydrodipicolinate reductase